LAEHETNSQRTAQTLLKALALVAITFVIYLPCLHGGKIFDDEIMLNPLVQSPAGLPYIWFKAMTTDYFPLTFTSLWLDYRVWGDDMFGYHFTNVLLHAISAILVWRVLRRLEMPGAWVAAMLFAVHPVNVESVAWVSQRKNALAMPFFLATILFYLKAKAANWNTKYYLLSIASFALALLAKTAVVPLPFVLLLCDWWQEKKFAFGRRQVMRVLPYFALSIALGVVTIWFQKHRVIGNDVVQTSSFAERFIIAGCALWFYLYKAFWPLNLLFIYPRWEISATQALLWIPLGAFVAMAIPVWVWRERLRGVVFALGYFVLMLLPVLGFLSIFYQKYSLVADHWQYFAIIGPIALVVALGSKLRAARIPVVVMVVAACAVLSWKQSHLYESGEIVWRDTIEKNPKCWVAHNDYGLELMRRAAQTSPPDKKLLDEAIDHYKESLRLRPDNVEAAVNMGSALIASGRVDDAKAMFKKAQQDFPNDALAFYNLGFILHQEHKLAEAEAEYRKAIKVWPQYTVAYLWLGRVLEQQSKHAEAESIYTEAERLVPVSLAVHRELASVLEAEGKLEPATREFETAIKLGSADPVVHYRLGNIFLKLKKDDEAVAQFEKVLELKPDFTEAHYQLAVYLAAHGKAREALAHYRDAVQQKPDWVPALNNAAWLLSTSKDDGARDGTIALSLASRAVMLTKTNDANALDTLAAALAESGRFDEAIATADLAAKAAASAKLSRVEAAIQQRRQAYMQKRPVRD
jgi:protein O-mannosyl-transferase